MQKYYDTTSVLKPDPYIRLIQLRLNSIREKYHHSWEKLELDGIYGPKTKTVVQKFQRVYKITPASGILGPTTSSYIVKQDQAPVLSIASAPLGNTPTNNSWRPTLQGTIEGVGNTANLGALLLNTGLPWHETWTHYVIEAFPEVYYKRDMRRNGPLFAFTKNDAYHRFGSYYNRVDIRNIGENVPRFLSGVAYICQLLTIRNKIEEYRRQEFSWQRFVSISAEITTLLTSSADMIVTLFPSIAEIGGYVAADGATAITAIGGGGLTLSAIGQMIGAFLLGMAIGQWVGHIPCGNGKIVQYYVDQYIYEIWEHPYKTIGWTICLGNPLGSSAANLIVTLKNAIEINVNRVSTLKPLTEVEKRKLEQYKLQHREMFIEANPPMSIRALK